MANLFDRIEVNAPGRYYVDTSCIDCDGCRSIAPEFFRRLDDEAFSMVYRQPVTAAEMALCEEALQGCPTDSIGRDGAG